MPERVAGLLGLLRRSGDEALGEALREAVRGMLERAVRRRAAAAMDGGAGDVGAQDG